MDRDGVGLSWHPFGRNNHDFAACPEHALAEIVEHIVNFRVIPWLQKARFSAKPRTTSSLHESRAAFSNARIQRAQSSRG